MIPRLNDSACLFKTNMHLDLLPYPILVNLLDEVFEIGPRDLLNLRKASKEFHWLINNYLTVERTLKSFLKNSNVFLCVLVEKQSDYCETGISLIRHLEIHDPKLRKYEQPNIKAFFHGLQPTFLYEIRWEAEKWLQYPDIQAHPLAWDLSLFTEFQFRFHNTTPQWLPKDGPAAIKGYAQALRYWVHNSTLWSERPWRLRNFPLHTECTYTRPKTDSPEEQSGNLADEENLDEYLEHCQRLRNDTSPYMARLYTGLMQQACEYGEFRFAVDRSGEVVLRQRRETFDERWAFESQLENGRQRTVSVRIYGEYVEIERGS